MCNQRSTHSSQCSLDQGFFDSEMFKPTLLPGGKVPPFSWCNCVSKGCLIICNESLLERDERSGKDLFWKSRFKMTIVESSTCCRASINCWESAVYKFHLTIHVIITWLFKDNLLWFVTDSLRVVAVKTVPGVTYLIDQSRYKTPDF